jgi:hypothetical protein
MKKRYVRFITVAAFLLPACGGLSIIVAASPVMPKKAAGSTPVSDADWASMNHGILPGTDGDIAAILHHRNTVYVGGKFTKAGGVPVNNIARWDHDKWDSLGSGMNELYAQVNALAMDSSGALYAGGDYRSLEGDTCKILCAKWNGTTWISLVQGMNNSGTIDALVIDGSGHLYAGGSFVAIGGIAAHSIARWDGSAWDSLGSGIRGGFNDSSTVSALSWDGDKNLYAGGNFTIAGNVSTNNIAKWNGAAWDSLGPGLTPGDSDRTVVRTLVFDASGCLYAGGHFSRIGATQGYAICAGNIAKWNGSAWGEVGADTNYGMVNALAMDGKGMLYRGGAMKADFSGAGAAAGCIAFWDGSKWNALKSEINASTDIVTALSFDSSSNLYAGGIFSVAGGLGVNHIGSYDGTCWNALGAGLDGSVTTITIDNKGNLFAAGSFTTTGRDSTPGIAQWNGSAWSAFGSKISDIYENAEVVAADGTGNLYIGLSGGMGIYKWNGTAWGAFQSISGDNAFCQTNALVGGDSGHLYASALWEYCDLLAYYTVQWNGSAWVSLGSGVNGTVYSFAFDGSGNCYAAGSFDTAGGIVAAGNIAKWNGTAWSALGSGTNKNPVYSLAWGRDGKLYAGGCFDTVGGIAAKNIAQWNGNGWSPLGSGVDSTVYALAADSAGNLYAGGAFGAAGGVRARFVAQWDGTSWNALGSGTDNAVRTLAIHDSTLFAGGDFMIAGGAFSPFIAKVNIHSSGSGIISKPRPSAAFAGVRYRLVNSTLVVSNIGRQDRISLYSLSGRSLREADGVSMMSLSDIAPQTLIVRIRRAEKVLSTGIVIMQ